MTETTLDFTGLETAFGTKRRRENIFLKLVANICSARMQLVDSTYSKSVLFVNIEHIWAGDHFNVKQKLEADIKQDGLQAVLECVAYQPLQYGPLRLNGLWRSDKKARKLAYEPLNSFMKQCAHLGAFVFGKYEELELGTNEQGVLTTAVLAELRKLNKPPKAKGGAKVKATA